MTLTILGHVTSSFTWPFESQWVISYWWSIGPKSLSPAVFEIFGPKHIEVTTLTFLVHVTSSVTWPFDSQVVISYRCSIGTKSVSPNIVEIMCTKYIGVMTLTILGHVTSSVTWLFESQVVISYRYSIGTKSVSPTIVEIMGPKYYWGHDLDLSGSLDVIGHVTLRIPMGHFLLVVHWTQVSTCISNGFRDILPQTSCSHRHNAKSSLRMRDITWHVPPM